MSKNSKNSNSSCGIIFLIALIIIIAIGSLIYSLLTNIKNWISDNSWWSLTVLFITTTSILYFKYSKYKKNMMIY